jgi:hypothetical protein
MLRSTYLIVALLISALALGGFIIRTASPTQPSRSTGLEVSAGNPQVHYLDIGLNNGGYTRIVSYEDIPIKVTSGWDTAVTLAVADLPDGSWARFIPDPLNVGPSSNFTTLVLAGMVEPFVATRYNVTVNVRVTSQNNTESETNIAVVREGNITIANAVQLIELQSFSPKWITNPNATSVEAFGIVYSPDGTVHPSTLNVHLSIGGLASTGGRDTLPDWLRISVRNQSFALSPNQPAYVSLMATTTAAPVGTYQIIVNETVNGEEFSVEIPLAVVPQSVSVPPQ